jgi:hypothetical protein
VTFHRGIDGSDPVRPEPVGRLAGPYEKRRVAGSWHLAVGTLACPGCDAPVAPPARPLSPADPIGCGFCDRTGAVRDFLSLERPSRPTRVDVRVVRRARGVRPLV